MPSNTLYKVPFILPKLDLLQCIIIWQIRYFIIKCALPTFPLQPLLHVLLCINWTHRMIQQLFNRWMDRITDICSIFILFNLNKTAIILLLDFIWMEMNILDDWCSNISCRYLFIPYELEDDWVIQVLDIHQY